MGPVGLLDQRHEEVGCASCLPGTEALDEFAIRLVENVKTCANQDAAALPARPERVDEPSDLSYSSPARGPIGSKRTRTRAGSKVTMLPLSKASTNWGRFASSVRANASGFGCPRREIG